MNKRIRILFIGNSHTYNHDLPALVKDLAQEDGVSCDVTMLAHGNWYLATHVREAQTKFNIRHGGYDYIVLQEHSHPFDHIKDYKAAVTTLVEWASEAGSRVVIYGTWAKRDDRDLQDYMNEVNREIAAENSAILAPVGESWWTYKDSHPEAELYEEDGAHASVDGAKLAASVIWHAIREA